MARRQPTQERGQKTQDEILEGAAAAFERSGFSATSLAEISDLSGISQGSMYFHFKSKEQIAFAVMREQHSRTYAHVEEALSTTTDPFEQIMRVSRALCDLLVSDSVVRAGIGLALDHGTLQEASAESYDEWARGIGVLLQRALNAGIIQPSIPVADLGRSLVGYFTGVQLMSQATTHRLDLLKTVGAMWSVMINAIVPCDSQSRYSRVRESLFHQ